MDLTVLNLAVPHLSADLRPSSSQLLWIELVVFKIRRDVAEADFLRAAAVTSTFLAGCEGFIRRRLAKSDADEWVEAKRRFYMTSRTLSTWAVRLDALGGAILRYGLVAILLYLGTFKFTSEEAHAIEPLVANSPLFSWLHAALGTRGTSNVIGSGEIVVAALIAARPLSPMTSALGSIASIGMFLSTLSFMFSTPGLWHFAEWYPLPVTNDAGFFLMKDIFLLGAAIWTAGEALGSAGGGSRGTVPVAKVA